MPRGQAPNWEKLLARHLDKGLLFKEREELLHKIQQ